MAQKVKRLPAVPETQVLSLGQEDPLEKEMTIHSSTLAWKIPWMEELGKQSMGLQRVRHDSATSLFFLTFWLLWIMLQWTLTYKYLFFPFSILDIYLGVTLLSHMVILCLVLWGSPYYFHSAYTIFHLHQQYPGSQFPHILDNACIFLW